MNPDRLGTAQWADPEQVAKRFEYREGALWLGRVVPGHKPIGVSDDRHVCLVAGTRSGKGTSVIIPNLCLWPGSLVVVDPTGDNATITASRRGKGTESCRGMGQGVHVLDPYRVSKVDEEYRATFNPLDMLDPGSRSVVRDAERIASSLVPPSTQSQLWALNGARRLIAGMILHVLTWSGFEGRRNLVTVRELIARGDIHARDRLRAEGDGEDYDAYALLWGGMTQNSACGGQIAAIGEEFERVARKAPEQWSGVHDEAISATNFINNPDMRDTLSSSTFSLHELRTSEAGSSIYLTVPSKDKDEDFRWLRLMVSLALNEMESSERKPACGHDVLMVLDEFTSLQRMDRIESGFAEYAKYGLKLFIVLQSLPQLKSVYGDNWETFLSSSGTKIFFGIDDQFTRDYVSNLIGETQIEIFEQSMGAEINRSAGSQDSTGESTSVQNSEGKSRSDQYKRSALGLRDTAGFFRKLTGNVTAIDTKDSSSTEGTSTERTTGTSTQEGTSIGRQFTQRIHKRPLVTPDEVGKLFQRIEECKGNALYPGAAIALLSSNPDPILFKRCNYYEDLHFEELFVQPPGHVGRTAIIVVPDPSLQPLLDRLGGGYDALLSPGSNEYSMCKVHPFWLTKGWSSLNLYPRGSYTVLSTEPLSPKYYRESDKYGHGVRALVQVHESWCTPSEFVQQVKNEHERLLQLYIDEFSASIRGHESSAIPPTRRQIGCAAVPIIFTLLLSIVLFANGSIALGILSLILGGLISVGVLKGLAHEAREMRRRAKMAKVWYREKDEGT